MSVQKCFKRTTVKSSTSGSFIVSWNSAYRGTKLSSKCKICAVCTISQQAHTWTLNSGQRVWMNIIDSWLSSLVRNFIVVAFQK